MTNALQKYDIGRVFPTPDALVRLLGDGFGAWIAQHTDARPVDGSTNLALSGGIYDEIHSLSNSLNILDGSIADRIAAAIGAELAAGGSVAGAITSAIQTLLDGPLATIQTTLTNQGVNIAGLLTDIATTVDAEVTDRMSRFPDLGIMQTTLESIKNLDLIKHLLAHDDNGEVVLDKIVLREVKTNPDQHRVLNLCEDGALNKEYYCITGDESTMTIVLPDSGLTSEGHNKVSDGDSVYIEYRSTGNGPAPVAAILSESEHNAAGGEAPTRILFGVLTSDTDGDATDNGLDMGAMYTRIRATYCYGKWMAEVVQFTDAEQEEADLYNVVYTHSYAGLDWDDFTAENILKGSYQLAGKQQSYCGMTHTGWNTQADGKGTHYALGQIILLDDNNTVPGDGQEANRKLVLYAEYASKTVQFAVATTSLVGNVVDSHWREGSQASAAQIYNASSVLAALAGWQEATVDAKISYWWCLGGPAGQASYVSAMYGTEEARVDKTGNRQWRLYEDAFSATLRYNSSLGAFELPTIITNSNEGCVIPFISSITFK